MGKAKTKVVQGKGNETGDTTEPTMPLFHSPWEFGLPFDNGLSTLCKAQLGTLLLICKLQIHISG